ncbi:tubulin-folding cofactor C [Apium graveolens]|uniref:tubulin-folding cofactor C n=1 Tax=Apium graveolens TaxID=4045 RepID=UPI003D7A3EC9
MDNQASSSPTDAATERKHAAMLDRLSRLHDSRNCLKSHDPNDTSFESTQTFLTNFNNSKLSIESQLSQIPKSCDPRSDINNVSVSISDLENLIAQNSYFLPPYELRASLKSVADLRQNLDVISSRVIPKKRFSFKAKKAVGNVSLASAQKVFDEMPVVESGEKDGVLVVRESEGFKGKENEVLVKEFKIGEEEIGEFMLSDLMNCEVRLVGCLRALFVHKLVNCRVYVGPVFGSVLIEEVEGCVFVMASHQIRIHHARGTDFYLRVRSRPIIEYCSGVRFAPYCLGYIEIDSDLKKSNLDEETGNWANVDDFKWLRAVQSPNWSILPESDRIATVNISGLEQQ